MSVFTRKNCEKLGAFHPASKYLASNYGISQWVLQQIFTLVLSAAALFNLYKERKWETPVVGLLCVRNAGIEKKNTKRSKSDLSCIKYYSILFQNSVKILMIDFSVYIHAATLERLHFNKHLLGSVTQNGEVREGGNNGRTVRNLAYFALWTNIWPPIKLLQQFVVRLDTNIYTGCCCLVLGSFISSLLTKEMRNPCLCVCLGLSRKC